MIVSISPTGVCGSAHSVQRYQSDKSNIYGAFEKPDKKPYNYKIQSVSSVKPLPCQSLLDRFKPNMMSIRTKKKIQDKSLMWWLSRKQKNDKHPFVFITLTYTAKVFHNHQDCNKMLNVFLTRLRNIKEFEYLWVNELQDNGNIHYHIICDKYFPIRIINKFWLTILENNGYPSKNKQGKNLNPVDISDKTYDSDSSVMASYVTKYVTKSLSKGIYARRWSCSRGISRLKTKIVVEIDEKEFDKIEKQQFFKNKKTGLTHIIERYYDYDYGYMYLPIVRPKIRQLLPYYKLLSDYNNKFVLNNQVV